MSNLKFTISFINKVTGAHRSAIVDLGDDFTAAELNEAWRGPGGLTGPVGQAVAFSHAVKTMPPDYVGDPSSVKAHRVQ